MRYLIMVLFLGIGFLVNAQDVSFNGVLYSIDKDRIFKGTEDVTEALSIEEKTEIRAAFDRNMLKIKEAKEAKKRLEKAESDKKKAEKKQKKAEKELKKSKKAQSNYDKAVKKHKNAVKKFEKLKKKGELSPVDEEKWLEKIEKYKEATVKAKKKL